MEGAERAVQVRVGGAMDTIALGGAEATEAGDVSFRGDAAMVRDSREGVERFALVRGTSLRLGEAELIASDVAVRAGAVIQDGLLRASIACDESATVTLRCPVEPGMVRLGGIEEPVDVRFDEEAGTVKIDIPLRYSLDPRDEARLFVAGPQLHGAGIEDISIGMLEHRGTGFGRKANRLYVGSAIPGRHPPPDVRLPGQ